MAFDLTTKQISTTFAPSVDGTVEVVLPTGDGLTVYVGGSFANVNGAPGKNLVKIRLSDGTVDSSFNPQNVAGKVTDLKLKNGRLWLPAPSLTSQTTTSGARHSQPGDRSDPELLPWPHRGRAQRGCADGPQDGHHALR